MLGAEHGRCVVCWGLVPVPCSEVFLGCSGCTTSIAHAHAASLSSWAASCKVLPMCSYALLTLHKSNILLLARPTCACSLP
jgi:hypothetical protein